MTTSPQPGDPPAAGPTPGTLEEPRCNICVGIATRGRPAVVAAVVDILRHQTLAPSAILISCVEPGDAGALASQPGVTVILGERGLTRQRNAVFDNLPEGAEVVAFFDDDFVPHPDWLRAAARVFADQPDVAAITGTVLADGIGGPGIGFDEALRRATVGSIPASAPTVENYTPYGCNMAFRRAAVADLRFDERLVLYGWLEDRDFGMSLVRRGWRVVKIGAATGVHMGVKSGRVSGRQLGYSQVVNPVYMNRKGTMGGSAVAHHMLRNIVANLVRSGRPEPHVDRFGRLCGNLIGLLDVFRGRLTPERAERL